jgi:hypothetical protein
MTGTIFTNSSSGQWSGILERNKFKINEKLNTEVEIIIQVEDVGYSST